MRFPWGWVGASIMLSASARADQFIVTDVTYTHAKDTTSDSHYRVVPSASTPKDWTQPVDFSKGSCHVLLEVKTKPNATPTKFQICFEGNPTYACTDQSPTYTKPGRVEWTSKLSSFYQGNGMQMNWANGVSKVALILKDTMNNKPQGDPNYVPSDLHVEVAIITADDAYEPPTVDAGVVDAGGPQDAGGAQDAGPPRDAGLADAAAPVDAGEVVPDSGSPLDAAAPRRDASAQADAAASQQTGPSRVVGAGCALGGPSGQGWLALLALAFRRRRGERDPRAMLAP